MAEEITKKLRHAYIFHFCRNAEPLQLNAFFLADANFFFNCDNGRSLQFTTRGGLHLPVIVMYGICLRNRARGLGLGCTRHKFAALG